MTTSNAVSAKGIASRSASRICASGTRCRAMSSKAGEASTAATSAPRRLARSVRSPAPQPASSRRVPAVTCPASSAAPKSGSATCSVYVAQSRARAPQSAPCLFAVPMCPPKVQCMSLRPRGFGEISLLLVFISHWHRGLAGNIYADPRHRKSATCFSSDSVGAPYLRGQRSLR